jgi:hypothetical protein
LGPRGLLRVRWWDLEPAQRLDLGLARQERLASAMCAQPDRRFQDRPWLAVRRLW